MPILYFQCETAREVSIKEMGSKLNLDNTSSQESQFKLYIYIHVQLFRERLSEKGAKAHATSRGVL